LVVRYEELRRHALGQCTAQAQGLALFMHRGMAAWLQAWSQCVGLAPARPPQDQPDCPVHLHKEVAMLLASMVLSTCQGASA
jgi:hypothetical protein